MLENASKYAKNSQFENTEICYGNRKHNLMWQYKCPNCENQTVYEKAPKKCPNCGEQFNQLKWRIPPKNGKNNQKKSYSHLLPKEGFASKLECAKWFAKKAGLNYTPHDPTEDELSDFAHKVIAPNLSVTYKKLLFQFFTEIFRATAETGDFSEWSNSGGTTNVITSPVHDGNYAFQFTGSGSSAEYYPSTDYSELHMRFYFRIPSLPDANTLTSFATFYDANWTRVIELGIQDNSGTLYLNVYSADSGNSATLFSWAANTWYCIEMVAIGGSGTGSLTVLIDNNEIESLTSQTINDSKYVKIGTVWTNSTGFVTVFDCIVVADNYIGGHTIFKEGFESGDFSNFDYVGGSPSVIQNQGYRGAYAMYITGSGADYARKDISPTNRLNCGFYLKITETMSDYSTFVLADFKYSSSAIARIQLYHTTESTYYLQVWRWTPSDAKSCEAVASLVLDTWHFIEFEGLIDSTAGYFKEYFDGELLDSETSLNTSGVGSFTRIRLGNNETGSVDYYIDDFVVSDVYIGANYIFENGFEQGDFSAWDSTTGTVSVVNTDRYNGDYSLKCEGSSDYVTKTIPSTTNVWVRAYWKTEAIPVTDYYSGYVCSGNGFEVRWNAMTGNGRWELLIDGSYGGSFIQSISPDVWYCVEVEFDADNNQHYLYIDGTQRISCANSTTTTVTSINVGQISGNWGQNTYLDCVVISDSYIGVIELFEDGFESGDLSAWDGIVEGLNGDVSIEPTIIKNGSYSLKCYDDAWGGTAYVYWDNGTNLSSVYVRAYFRFVSLPISNGDYVSFIALRDMDDYVDRVGVSIYHDGSTSNFRLTMTGGTADFGSQVTADTWYCVEIFADWNSGNSTLYIDGSFDCSITDGDTGETTRYFKIGLTDRATTDHSYTFYVDDVVVSNTYIGGSEQEEIVNLPFTDGFESGDFSAWGGENENQGSVDVTTANPHCGTYCLESTLAQGQNNGWGDCYTEISGNNPVYIRAMKCIFANPPNTATEDQTALCFRETTTGNGLAYAGIKNDNGTLKWWVWYRDEESFSDQLGNNFDSEPHHLEFAIYQDSSAGWVKLYVDGELEIEVTGLNNADRELNYASVGFSYSDAPTDSVAKFYADCVVVDDTLIGPEQEEEPPAGAEAGFETGDVSEFDDTVTSNGTVTASDSVAHHGTYSCKCDVNADGSAYAEGYFDVAEQQPVYCRGYFRFNQLPETNKDYTLICFENTDGSTTVGYVQLIDDGGTKKWKIMRTTSGGATYSTSTTNIPSVDTWVCIEFAHGENLAKLWVDGNELLTHIDTTNQTTNRVHVGACSTDIDADDTLEIHVDCIVVDDEYIGPESDATDLEVNNLTVNNTITIGEDTVLSTDESVLYVKESDESPADLNVGTLTATELKTGELKKTDGAAYVLDLDNMPNQGTNGYVLTAQGDDTSPVWAPAGSSSVTWTAVPSSIIPISDDTYDLGSDGSAWRDVYSNDGHIGNLTANAVQVGTSGLSGDQGGAIELGDSSQTNTKPYIDFHYGKSGSEDYNIRLQNDGDKQFNISAIASGGKLNISNMELAFEGDTKISRDGYKSLKINGDLAIDEILRTHGPVFCYDEMKFVDANAPSLTKEEIVKAIYGFEHGKWNPLGFTLGDSYITFRYNVDPGIQAELFVIHDSQSSEPLVTTNRGLVVQKDISAGGFVGSNQGAIGLGSGLQHRLDVPKIALTNSYSSRLDGGGFVEPVPKGPEATGDPAGSEGDYYLNTSYNPDQLKYHNGSSWIDVTVNGQVFWNETQNKIYYYNGGTQQWIELGNPSDFEGYFDTLYITKELFGLEPANINCGKIYAQRLTSENGDLNLGSSDTNKTLVNGDLEVTGNIIGQITQVGEKGSDTTAANGIKNVTFSETYNSPPLVFLQPIDGSGRGIVLDLVSTTTSGFTVKAHYIMGHKHVVGRAEEVVQGNYWNPTLSNEPNHTHTGSSCYGSTNSNGSHTHSLSGYVSTSPTHTHSGDGTHPHAPGSESSHTHLVTGITGWIANGSPGSAHTHYGAGGSPDLQTGYPDAHTHTISGGDGGHDHTGGSHSHGNTLSVNSGGIHNHGFSGDVSIASNGAHTHTLEDHYARSLYMRDINGSSYTVGAVLTNTSKSATDLYTEEINDSDYEVAVTFNYLVLPSD